MKKIIIISLVMLLNITLLTGCGKKTINSDNQNNEQKENQNISENTKVIGSQTIGSITFEVISLKYENEISTLKYKMTNKGTDKMNISKYKISIYDDNEIIYEFDREHKNNVLGQNETRNMKKEIPKDLTKATSITFELIEE